MKSDLREIRITLISELSIPYLWTRGPSVQGRMGELIEEAGKQLFFRGKPRGGAT
jgi:hypothetical protein